MKTKNPVVYVTKFQPSWDFQPAKEFGAVVFLTSREHRPMPVPPEYNDSVTDEMVDGLCDYVAGKDYIALTAAAIPNSIVMMWLQMLGGTHKILRWNNSNYTYEEFEVKTVEFEVTTSGEG